MSKKTPLLALAVIGQAAAFTGAGYWSGWHAHGEHEYRKIKQIAREAWEEQHPTRSDRTERLLVSNLFLANVGDKFSPTHITWSKWMQPAALSILSDEVFLRGIQND